MSNKSSLVPFLTGDEDQNLHVKIVKNSGKPGLNCTENSSACDRPYFHFKFVILSVMNFCSLTCNSHGTGPGFMLLAIE